MTFIWLQITSLIYISILIGVYFSKKRLKNLENNLFIYMMIANAVGLILEIFCYFTLMYITKIPVINFIGKLEKPSRESVTNLIFLDKVHLDFPISLFCLV